MVMAEAELVRLCFSTISPHALASTVCRFREERGGGDGWIDDRSGELMDQKCAFFVILMIRPARDYRLSQRARWLVDSGGTIGEAKLGL